MKQPILTIAVCSIMERRNNFLPNILDQLNTQAEAFDDIEILCLVDNKTMMLGEKRNRLVEMAAGEYIVFVDDDDVLSSDYVKELRKGILESRADVITFIVNVSLNGEPFKPCFYSISHKKDFNSEKAYYRIPNHIMCVKTEYALLTKYKPIAYGEDSDYAKRLLPMLNTECQLDKVLYYYNFNQATTATQPKQTLKRIK